MADEAFALSPISARATRPSEEDYDAIREAFMETSRGRWFLGEYAKRNRNADTRMVLDAVARIEETLAAQKTPAPDPALAEALIGIRASLDEAQAAASAALGDLALEENLAPARKGARVIREIAWRLREIGADGRICDLIDSQVSAIEGACGKTVAIDPANALSAAFDLIERRIAAFDDGDAVPVPPAEEAVRSSPQAAEEARFSARATEEAVPSPAPAALDAAPAAGVEPTQAANAASKVEAAINPPVPAETSAAMAEVAEAEAIFEPAEASAEAADAYDEALLEMVALEMAAPQPVEAVDSPYNENYEIEAVEMPAANPIRVAGRPEPKMAAPVVQPVSEPAVEPSHQPSLGSSLIANGIVQRPRASRHDPLAPIRRMSQTEKIAFFS